MTFFHPLIVNSLKKCNDSEYDIPECRQSQLHLQQQASDEDDRAQDDDDHSIGDTSQPSENTVEGQNQKDDEKKQRNSDCKAFADPWKRPADMDQATFERYVEEIVRALEPVIPPNPFAVPREPSSNAEPDCDRIRLELEALLAAVDDCTNPPMSSCPTAAGSCSWQR